MSRLHFELMGRGLATIALHIAAVAANVHLLSVGKSDCGAVADGGGLAAYGPIVQAGEGLGDCAGRDNDHATGNPLSTASHASTASDRANTFDSNISVVRTVRNRTTVYNRLDVDVLGGGCACVAAQL